MVKKISDIPDITSSELRTDADFVVVNTETIGEKEVRAARRVNYSNVMEAIRTDVNDNSLIQSLDKRITAIETGTQKTMTEGYGIDISDSNVISLTSDIQEKIGKINNYQAGSGITITTTNGTPSISIASTTFSTINSISNKMDKFTCGDGLKMANNVLSLDLTTVTAETEI